MLTSLNLSLTVNYVGQAQLHIFSPRWFYVRPKIGKEGENVTQNKTILPSYRKTNYLQLYNFYLFLLLILLILSSLLHFIFYVKDRFVRRLYKHYNNSDLNYYSDFPISVIPSLTQNEVTLSKFWLFPASSPIHLETVIKICQFTSQFLELSASLFIPVYLV